VLSAWSQYISITLSAVQATVDSRNTERTHDESSRIFAQAVVAADSVFSAAIDYLKCTLLLTKDADLLDPKKLFSSGPSNDESVRSPTWSIGGAFDYKQGFAYRASLECQPLSSEIEQQAIQCLEQLHLAR
jgi:hypothetical protein